MSKSKCDWFGHKYSQENNSTNEPGFSDEECVRCEHAHTRIEGHAPLTQPFINTVVKWVLPPLLLGFIFFVYSH